MVDISKIDELTIYNDTYMYKVLRNSNTMNDKNVNRASHTY